MDETAAFGQWLRQRRKALDLTQKELARQVGCAEITIRKLEAGGLFPSHEMATTLAQGLMVPPADLPAFVQFPRGEAARPAIRWGKPQPPHNLPIHLTHLLGREQEIFSIRRRLASEDARFLTLVGSPGVGKTRLALAVANSLEQHSRRRRILRGPGSDREGKSCGPDHCGKPGRQTNRTQPARAAVPRVPAGEACAVAAR